jgi:hypothetical protein
MSDKIKTQHLERKAILYVRQSSAYQVSHNLESQKLQYAMQERLEQLGWREIEVVDEDLGRSAAGTVTRAGFERLVAEVCLGKVGAVAAPRVATTGGSVPCRRYGIDRPGDGLFASAKQQGCRASLRPRTNSKSSSVGTARRTGCITVRLIPLRRRKSPSSCLRLFRYAPGRHCWKVDQFCSMRLRILVRDSRDI